MNIFITGGNGFVGRHLLMWLASHMPESQIVCLVRDFAKSAWMDAYPNVTRLQGDLLQPESYRFEAMQADLVFHAAALVGLRNGDAFYTQNTEATKCLLDILKVSSALSRLVYVSSISAIDRPLEQKAIGALSNHSQPHPNTDYGKSKLYAEQAIIVSGLPYTILRPSYIYGPYPRIGSSIDRLLQDVLTDKPYTHLPFTGRASAIYAPDLAEALWRASRHVLTLNRTYFVSHPKPYAVSHVFQEVAHALGKSGQAASKRRISPALFERFQRFCYVRYPAQPLVRVLFEDSFYCDSSPLWQDLSWQPQTTLAEGIQQTLIWYEQAGILKGKLAKTD